MRRSPQPAIADPGDVPGYVQLAGSGGETHCVIEYLPRRYALGCADTDAPDIPREAVWDGLPRDVTCEGCPGG